MDYFTLLVAGFAFGLAATVIMTTIQYVFWRRWGLTGVLEWHENQMIWSKLKGSDPSVLSPFGIFFLHFVNGGLAGVLFPVIMKAVPALGSVPIALLGVVYGVLLWLLTLFPIHEPITGISITSHPLGRSPITASLLGHAVYGILLSLLTALII